MVARACGFVELLESRIAPASVIQVYFNHGDLTLIGVAGDHSLTLTGTDDGGVVVAPGDGTEIRWGDAPPTANPLTIAKAIRDIRITLGDGEDSVQLSQFHLLRNVTVAMGGGENSFLLDGSDLLGSLTVTGHGEDNSAVLQGEGVTTSIGGDLAIRFSGTTDQFYASGASLLLGGDFSYHGVSRFNDISFYYDSIRIDGAIEFANGAASGKIELSTKTSTDIHGPVRITSASPAADGLVGFFETEGSLHFGSKISFITGAGQDALYLYGQDISVAGNIVASMGSGTDVLDISGAAIAIQGTITARSKSPAQNTGFYVTIDALNRLTLGGELTVQGGSGDDDFWLFGPGTVAAKIRLDLGAGTNVAEFSSTNSPGPVPADAGQLILNGPVDFFAEGQTKISDDRTRISFQNVTFNGATHLRTGGGTDIVGGNNLQINAPLTVHTGAGADLVDFGDAQGKVAVNAPVTLSMGSGADTVNWGGIGGSIDAEAQVFFSGGNGLDVLNYRQAGDRFTPPEIVTGFESIV